MNNQINMFGAPTKEQFELNPDGYSIKGCSYIYTPRGQAGEYSMLATNPFRGCGHKCVYCYVPKVLKMDRIDFDAIATPRPNYLDNLKKDAMKYRANGITKQVMLSFTTDPYNPFDVEAELTRKTIMILREYGLAFCTLTKGGERALRDIDLFRPQMDAFASTITSLDSAFSLKWERGAALPDARIATLRKFHDAGIFTWVSLEPVLNTEATLRILEETHPFVDFYKIGRTNYLPQTKTTDWESFTHRVIDVCQKYSIKHYIKHDLQPFLPTGYNNQMRVEQNNG
jgi:DNA repair photolyase